MSTEYKEIVRLWIFRQKLPEEFTVMSESQMTKSKKVRNKTKFFSVQLGKTLALTFLRIYAFLIEYV